jgi:hypothetical protein
MFKLPMLTKKRNPGMLPKELFFGSFREDKDQCFGAYVRDTCNLRPQHSTESNPLFISPQGGDITEDRSLAENSHGYRESTQQPLQHTPRGELPPAALEKGVSIKEILQTADWSSELTFYYQLSSTPSRATFAEKVLS